MIEGFHCCLGLVEGIFYIILYYLLFIENYLDFGYYGKEQKAAGT